MEVIGRVGRWRLRGWGEGTQEDGLHLRWRRVSGKDEREKQRVREGGDGVTMGRCVGQGSVIGVGVGEGW